MLNHDYWRRVFDEEFAPQLRGIVEALETRVLPGFEGIEQEAEHYSDELWKQARHAARELGAIGEELRGFNDPGIARDRALAGACGDGERFVARAAHAHLAADLRRLDSCHLMSPRPHWMR